MADIVTGTRRHEKYDSALDSSMAVEPKDDSARLRELEEENGLLAQKATAAGRSPRSPARLCSRGTAVC